MSSVFRKALFVVALAICLLAVGIGVYPILFPIYYWSVDCFIDTNSGKVFGPSMKLPEERMASEYAALAKKRGETCTLTPVREFRGTLIYRKYSN